MPPRRAHGDPVGCQSGLICQPVSILLGNVTPAQGRQPGRCAMRSGRHEHPCPPYDTPRASADAPHDRVAERLREPRVSLPGNQLYGLFRRADGRPLRSPCGALIPCLPRIPRPPCLSRLPGIPRSTGPAPIPDGQAASGPAAATRRPVAASATRSSATLAPRSGQRTAKPSAFPGKARHPVIASRRCTTVARRPRRATVR